MPIRNLTPEQEEAQRETELAARKAAQEVRAEKYEHELKLAELKAGAHIEAAAIGNRRTMVAAICKALTLPLAVLCVTILTLKNREIPEVLADFLRL